MAPTPPKPTGAAPSKAAAVVPPKPAPVASGAAPTAAAVSAEVAMQHFRELLRAKQDRVRQGPSYPAPNAYTGRHDSVDIVENVDTDE
jgi:hypothetical protein